MDDDPLLRELTAHPKHRRILVTDGRSATGHAVARALAASGAAEVRVGIARPWLPFDGQQHLADDPDLIPIDLDITSETSVREAAAALGGKTDILINTAGHVRPGGVLGRTGLATARDEFEVEVFGLQRLVQAFSPAMMARAADGDTAAAAIVDILSVRALAAGPDFGAHSAAAAARRAVLQTLRHEVRPAGLRVLSIFTGPIDDDWHQPLPPPKVAPKTLADAVVHALETGIEDTFVGAVAQDVATRWRDDPKLLEQEMPG